MHAEHQVGVTRGFRAERAVEELAGREVDDPVFPGRGIPDHREDMQVRRRHRRRRDPGRGEDALPDEEMERNLEDAWRDNIFERALARVKQRANPKSFQVFDCVVLRNMAPAEVASMLGLNAAQVYLAKHRVSVAVKRAAKQIEQELCSREKVR